MGKTLPTLKASGTRCEIGPARTSTPFFNTDVGDVVDPHCFGGLKAADDLRNFPRTRALAWKLYFWPGMSTQIASLIDACDKCQNLRPSLKSEPLQQLPVPKDPMQTVSMDLYKLKSTHFLVMCDRYSFFCWVSHLTTLRMVTVIQIICGLFKILGYPQYIYSG
jgi:hypothetical protein